VDSIDKVDSHLTASGPSVHVRSIYSYTLKAWLLTLWVATAKCCLSHTTPSQKFGKTTNVFSENIVADDGTFRYFFVNLQGLLAVGAEKL
jgi:hypothetical protein